MFEGDDDNQDYPLFYQDDGGAECMYSDEELCQFVFETLERFHPIKIAEIEYRMGYFYFSVSADLTKEIGLPAGWYLRSFGDGKVNFSISLNDFQEIYNKLEERDLMDSIRVAISKLYGKVCDIVSIRHLQNPMFEGGVEVIIRLKEGCKFDNKPWLPIQWIEGDLIAFEIDYDEYRTLIESNEYNSPLH